MPFMHAQMWNEEDGEDEVLAMVARTGLRTTVGRLLQQVMTSVHATPPRMDTFVAVSLLVIDHYASCCHPCHVCLRAQSRVGV